MTCDEVRATFSDLYDNAMSGAELAALHQHLQGCPACRTEWNAFQRAMQAVTDLGRAEPSPGFAARVRERLEAPPLWQRALRWLFLPLYVKVPIQAVALILVAFAGLLLFQQSPELRREVETFKAVSPPVTREVPGPAAPPSIAQPVEKPKPLEPRAEPSRPTSPPDARVESKGEAAISVLRDEAKELEAVQAPVLQSAPMPTRAKESQVSSIPPGSADQLYSTAMTDLNRQSYDRAIDNLRAFIQQNPKDARIPDARMRLGDAYVAQQRFREAISEYETLTREYPDSSLIPSALLRQAQARLALGDQTGCQLLRELAGRYPHTPEAALAREALSSRCS